jgi:hypothetical protein
MYTGWLCASTSSATAFATNVSCCNAADCDRYRSIQTMLHPGHLGKGSEALVWARCPRGRHSAICHIEFRLPLRVVWGLRSGVKSEPYRDFNERLLVASEPAVKKRHVVIAHERRVILRRLFRAQVQDRLEVQTFEEEQRTFRREGPPIDPCPHANPPRTVHTEGQRTRTFAFGPRDSLTLVHHREILRRVHELLALLHQWDAPSRPFNPCSDQRNSA